MKLHILRAIINTDKGTRVIMSSRVLYLLCAVLLVGSWVAEATTETEDQTQQSAVAWNNKGAIFYNMKDYNEALQAYDNAIKINPLYAEAWANKGVALYDNGSYQEAIRAFNRSISIDPTEGWVWYARGSVYYRLGNYNESLKSYNEALKLNPSGDANIWADKGYALYYLGDYSEALQAFHNSTLIDPNKAWVWNAIGDTYSKQGKNKEALAAYDKAIYLTQKANTS
jgi:tetratricopeptide (TPR) repeat protein